MDITHLGGIVAGIGLLASIAGTVIGAKVTLALLQASFQRFEKAVWEAIEKDRDKAEKVSERLAKVEAICDLKRREGICEP